MNAVELMVVANMCDIAWRGAISVDYIAWCGLGIGPLAAHAGGEVARRLEVGSRVGLRYICVALVCTMVPHSY